MSLSESESKYAKDKVRVNIYINEYKSWCAEWNDSILLSKFVNVILPMFVLPFWKYLL